MLRIRYNLLLKIVLLLFFLSPLSVSANNELQNAQYKISNADSILSNIFDFSPFYSKVINNYTADLYIKGRVNVLKSNHLIRYIPSMFTLDKNRKNYIIESSNELNYTYPNIYDRKLKAVSGTFKRNTGEITDMMDFFNMNVYSSSLMTDKLLSPLDKQSSRYYYYSIDSTFVTNGTLKYKLSITPRFRSTQLVKGYVVVSDKNWIVREMCIEGVYDLTKFYVKLEMGKEGEVEELLPKFFTMNLDFNFLWNHLKVDCGATLKYKEINIENTVNSQLEKKKNKFDLTDSYRLTCDTSALKIDRDSFNVYRLLPLTKSDSLLYKSFDVNRELEKSILTKKPRNVELWGQVGDVLLNSYNLNLYGIGSVRCSPLINPFMFSYSHSNGVSYKQKFKYNKLFNDSRLLRIVPQIGYNFTRKELYAQSDFNFVYNPKKIASINLNVGNGNRIYSSVVLDKLKELPDSTFNFNDVDLDYFKDIHLDLSHSIEILNGLSISTGIIMHWRYLVNDSKLKLQKPLSDEEYARLKGIKSQYNSFSPNIKISWTPDMYYYMNGKRKMNVGSKMPTFILDYERGLKGIFGSNGAHERWEVEVQQKLVFNGIKSLGYRVGAGLFTKQDNVYFIDFDNFRRHNLPEGWNDDIGGTFQLLDGRWYNASRKYFRTNLTYESPYLLLKAFNKMCSKIQQERLYGGILFMPHLKPYVEIGYGIGTHIFDIGVFASVINGEFDTVGMKFTFELFNK